jgi:hypothetical protein
VLVSENKLAVIKLGVCEFAYCYAVSLRVSGYGGECCSDCVGAGPLGFGVGDKACVKGYVMYASKGCRSDFESELVGWFGKGVHTYPFYFRNRPPGCPEYGLVQTVASDMGGVGGLSVYIT